ncbi:uncharacterized protein LOC144905436 [Branchiostoma floridae x Branchiostoma belcheri]
MPLGVGTGNIRRLGAKCPSALAPGTSAAWERNAPLALAPGTSVKEGDGAELPPPRPKFPPGSEELGSPTVPKLGGEKSPPPPSETPFPPGFDAASFLQWISSSRQPRDVDGAVASTSRTGVVGSGREHPGSEVEECSEEGKIAFSDSDEAHSTRGASTSAAAAAGVSLHSIMKAADWSRESTFLKYYRRDNNQHTFGQAVLSTALKSA